MDENEVTEAGQDERARYPRRPFTFDRTVRIFFTIAVVLAVLWLVGYLKGVLLPFEVAKMLRDQRTYLDIAEKTGASTATISRVNRSLNYGNDGYDMVFNRLEEEESSGN